MCREQLATVAAEGLTVGEIERAKGQVKGSAVLGQEDTSARMTRIARSELHDLPLLSIGSILDRVDAVSQADIAELGDTLLTQQMSLAVVGPFDDSADFLR